MSTESNTLAADQHFIPKFYLKGFTDKSHTLWVCEKGKKIRGSKPKEEANRPDYYTHYEQGKRDTTAEDAFRHIESVVATPIAKLANPQYEFPEQKRKWLYLFVALMFARVPAWREYLNRMRGDISKKNTIDLARNAEKWNASMRRYQEASGQGFDLEEMRQYALRGEYEVLQTSIGYNLGAMFDSAFSINRLLKDYDYCILYAPEGSFFVTSDSPVVTLAPDGKGKAATVGVGFLWANTHVYFPLNKRACLKLRRRMWIRGAEISERSVQQLNRLFMGNATRYLYTSQGSKRIARLFDEHGCKSRAGVNAFMTEPKRPSAKEIKKKLAIHP